MPDVTDREALTTEREQLAAIWSELASCQANDPRNDFAVYDRINEIDRLLGARACVEPHSCGSN